MHRAKKYSIQLCTIHTFQVDCNTKYPEEGTDWLEHSKNYLINIQRTKKNRYKQCYALRHTKCKQDLILTNKLLADSQTAAAALVRVLFPLKECITILMLIQNLL